MKMVALHREYWKECSKETWNLHPAFDRKTSWLVANELFFARGVRKLFEKQLYSIH